MKLRLKDAKFISLSVAVFPGRICRHILTYRIKEVAKNGKINISFTALMQTDGNIIFG